ncbi:MAG: TetR/AcrR family transcriptional regulator [Chloroflexi bacterium]|nr:TetR/AcrR family transcriptional regulator [Chloroflexota bacterium]
MDEAGSERRQRRRERMANEILQAAARVFARRGFDGATVREIAEEADIAEGTIYNYFESKEDLLIQLPRLVGGPLFELAVQPALQDRTLENVDDEVLMVQTMRQGLANVLQHIDILKILFSSMPVAPPETQDAYLRQFILQVAGVLESFIQRRIEQGRFRAMNPTIVARAWMGSFLIFILTQEILPGRLVTPMDYDEVIDEIVHLFLYGVQTRKEGVAA